jgi:putative hydrolase of the HAD superfamily
MEAVIFDYGGVLCFYPSEEQIDELAALCGVSRAEFLNHYWGLRVPYDRGDYDGPGYWERFGQQSGRAYSASQIREFIDRDIQFWLNVDKRMIGWVREMRAAGIKLGLISNLPIELGEYIRANSMLFELFDHVTLSYEQRTVKPDAAIYRECVEGLGVEPHDALFLDDKEPNVLGARAAGLQSLLFETPGQLSEILAREHHLAPFGTPPIDLG